MVYTYNNSIKIYLFKVTTLHNIDVHWTYWHCHEMGSLYRSAVL